MINFLNSKFVKLTNRSKYILICLCALSADITILFYAADLVKKALLHVNTNRMLQVVGISNQQMELLQNEQFLSLFISTLQSVLALFLLFNSVIYLSCIFGKKWASKYVKNYLFFGVILSLLECGYYLFRFQHLNFYTIASMGLYFLAYYFMKKSQIIKSQ